jgi:hypothetical protein
MIDKLPVHPWRRKVMEEAEKRAQHGVLVLEGMPHDTTEAEVAELIAVESGQHAVRVQRDGKRVRVQTANDRHKELIKMLFDRQQLQCGATVTVAPEAVELSGDDVDRLMLRWLRIDARIAPAAGFEGNTYSGMQPRGRVREVREEDARAEDSEGDEVDEVDVQRSRKDKKPAKPKPPAAPQAVPMPEAPKATEAPDAWSHQAVAQGSQPWQQQEQAWSNGAWHGKGWPREGKGWQDGGGWHGGKGWHGGSGWQDGKGQGKGKGGEGKGKGGEGSGKGKGKGKGAWQGGRGGRQE